MESTKPTASRQHGFDDLEDDYELSWIDVIRPAGMFNFFTMWMMSRQVRLLLVGLPFLVLAGGGAVFALWLRHAPVDDLILRFEDRIQQAVENERTDHALVMMNGLIQLRPKEPRYRYNRARLMLENQQGKAGLATMLDITPVDARGHVGARMWLVRQSLSAEPLMELSDDDRLTQMRRAVREEPDNLEAHQLLAMLFINQKQFRLAEAHLVEVVRTHPKLALDLARIQRQIGRDAKVVSSTYATAAAYFGTMLKNDPHSVADRIGWAECMVAEGRLTEADALLREGLQGKLDEQIQNAVATIQARLAGNSIAESSGNTDQALEFILESLQLNPNNAQALSLLFLLSEAGVVVDQDRLAPVVEIYSARQNDEATATIPNVIVLTGLLKASGDTQRAVALLRPLIDDEPSLRLVLAQLSESIGEVEESRRLSAEVLKETQRQLIENPGDVSVLVNHANALNIARKFAETIQVLDAYLTAAKQTPREQPAGFRKVYGTACLGIFDQSEGEATTGRVELLAKALTVGHSVNTVIQRLAALCVSDSSDAFQAESALNQLAANRQLSAVVYRQIGDAAMQKGQAARAVRFYDLGLAIKPNDLVLLNNMASALISQSPNNADKALEFANAALLKVPYQADVLVTRAEILLSMKRWQDARLDLEAALQSRKTSPVVHRLLVQAYTELEEHDQAADHQSILIELTEK